MPFKRVLIAILYVTSFLCTRSTSAGTLDTAMRAALESNPALAAERARLEAALEALPQAKAGGLPALSLGTNTASNDSHYDTGDSARQNVWSSTLTASQLLYSGGRIHAATREARAKIAAARATYDKTAQQLLLDVVKAYAQLREAEAAVQARTQAVANLETQRRYQDKRITAGLATRTDLAQAQARLSQGHTRLIQARGELLAVRDTYLRLVGQTPDVLQPIARVTGLPQTWQAALLEAQRSNPILVAANAAEEAADAAVSIARSSLAPKITLEAQYELTGNLRRSDGDTSSNRIGIYLNLPLSSGGETHSRIRQSHSLAVAALRDRESAELQVRNEVTTAFGDVETANAASAAAREQLTAAEIANRGVNVEQEVGLRSTIEVLDQETDLLDARLAIAAAERNLAISEYQLLKAIGGLRLP